MACCAYRRSPRIARISVKESECFFAIQPSSMSRAFSMPQPREEDYRRGRSLAGRIREKRTLANDACQGDEHARASLVRAHKSTAPGRFVLGHERKPQNAAERYQMTTFLPTPESGR